MIVVDSNVLAAKCLTSSKTSLARQVEERDPIWIVPQLWRYEFQNILAKSIWALQIMPGDAVEIWRKVFARMSCNEHDPSVEKVIELSARHRITACDANFIALAMEKDVICVTEDAELQRKFPACAVSMTEFINRDTSSGEVREAPTTYRVQRRTMKVQGSAGHRRVPEKPGRMAAKKPLD